MSKFTLGIGGSNHDFGAAVAAEGELIIAIEDERIQKVKRGRVDWNSLPAKDSVEYCLHSLGMSLGDFAGVFCCDDLERPAKWIDWSSVTFINHHLCHAAASFYTSSFEESSLLVIDGHGSPLSETDSSYEVETISYGYASQNQISLKPLQTGAQRRTSSSWRYLPQNSIGWFYKVVTMAIGFGSTELGKTMGLSAFGDEGLIGEMASFVDIRGDGRFVFDPYGGLQEWLAELISTRPNSMQLKADIASAAQELLTQAIVSAALEAHRSFPSENLSFGGGCALNTIANSRILSDTAFKRIAVFPAAGDNGLSVGAALYGSRCVLDARPPHRSPGWQARQVYVGREYSETEVDHALVNAPVSVSKPIDIAFEASSQLAGGKTVAIWRGRSEVGPRALGNRSLLALPGPESVRDHINLVVKKRESFRPLAPVVPIEYLSTYFEGLEESPYMLLVARVKDRYKDLLGAVTHIDGTARVQTVRREDNQFLHDLLTHVGEKTGTPVLLNTSLNFPGMPIVETPLDALKVFIELPIDAMIIGDRVLTKYTPWCEPPQRHI